MIDFLVASFAIGFLGSLHCVGMCGGLVSALSLTREKIWWPGITTYQIGRVTTYTAIGFIIGFIGSVLNSETWFGGLQQTISIIAGILIVLLALHIAGWLPDPFSKLANGISNTFGFNKWISAAATQNSTTPWYVAGLINGLLPCGLVYAAVGLSLTATTVGQGVAGMFMFGLGTVPAMMATPKILHAMSATTRSKIIKAGAVLLILIGLMTIVRGTPLGQHDHDAHSHHHANAGQIDALDPNNFCIIPPQTVTAKESDEVKL